MIYMTEDIELDEHSPGEKIARNKSNSRGGVVRDSEEGKEGGGEG